MNDRPTHPWYLDPLAIVELFVLANLGFLAVDIFVAHSMNDFRHPAEWVPFAFSLAAPPALAVGMIRGGVRGGRRGPGRWIGLVVGFGAIVVGVAGMLLHMESHFFEHRTLKSLVYAAPFVAPLAYAGLGLLLVLNRTVDDRSPEWAMWVVFLAWGGFVGNFGLSLLDHAQNGFFNPAEWVSVFAAALAVGFFLVPFLRRVDRRYVIWCAGVGVLQVLVGVAGFALHAWAILHGPMDTLWESIIYGAPVFAPLLFANVAALAGIGLWAMVRNAAVVDPHDARSQPAGA